MLMPGRGTAGSRTVPELGSLSALEFSRSRDDIQSLISLRVVILESNLQLDLKRGYWNDCCANRDLERTVSRKLRFFSLVEYSSSC